MEVLEFICLTHDIIFYSVSVIYDIMILWFSLFFSIYLPLSFFPLPQLVYSISAWHVFCFFLGLTFGSKTISNNLNSKAKSAVPKSSTLMKPTASQLAKQNRPSKNIGSRWWLIRIIFLFLVVKETWFFSWVGEVEWQYELPFILNCNILLHYTTLSLFAQRGALKCSLTWMGILFIKSYSFNKYSYWSIITVYLWFFFFLVLGKTHITLYLQLFHSQISEATNSEWT